MIQDIHRRITFMELAVYWYTGAHLQALPAVTGPQRDTRMERKENMPLWVFLGLMTIETRKGAMILFWCSFAFALFCIPLSWYLNDWWWFGIMLPISIWYLLSIKWVDRHALWD